jgi:hypothetical protein
MVKVRIGKKTPQTVGELAHALTGGDLEKASPAEAAVQPSAQPAAPAVTVANGKATVTLPFVRESPVYLDVLVAGKLRSLTKANCTGWEIGPAKAEVTVTMPVKYARRRELLPA